MPTDHPHSIAQIALASTLTLAIFSLPWWSLSQEPQGPLVTHAHHPSTDERVATWLLAPELADAPVPTPPLAPEEPSPQPATATAPPEAAAPAMSVTASSPSPTSPPLKLPSEQTSLAKHATSAPPSTPTPSKKRSKRHRRDCRPDVAEIDSTRAGHWRVQRNFIDHYARNLREAEKLARVSWARNADDQIIGFQVIRVRCGSPLWDAGFRDGDIITAINGQRVRTVPQALTAYVALRIKRTLRVRGQRKDGTPIDHRYRLT